MRILAVSPGARTTGLAVLGADGQLCRFDVIPLGRQRTTEDKARRLRLHLTAVLDIERPAEVLCEALRFGRTTLVNEQLAASIHDVVIERGLPLRYVPLRDARTSLGLGRDLAADLAGRFPSLGRFVGDGENQRRYWSRAFAALAIALAQVPLDQAESQASTSSACASA